ncbi:MAG: UDP-N-acetylmuramate:L-alanyl-gamma-D-glutamyl-meso-diaminopimelate ligase [Spongiibacteraceae bacterium]|nr:UDP-N-acetylmuramate:L-alanyl-gamma-D-glutamyl-meso-diaminopimelate ligase [Spongiibacteraceae bacterium]
MHIHVLGICGTFMGGLAILARQLGHQVTGSDANVYPPMSTQLQEQGISLTEGYSPTQLDPAPDLIVVGNAMTRGNPVIEAMLDQGLPYISGPQWLSEHLLQDKWVLACAGTHGKTTTSSMLAWILEYADYKPGYLIGGVPSNFGISARIGDSAFFVIEADEYDTAFFDKRSKFVHYHPRTVVLNNLEFDHADIFENLAAIQKQFHHLVRIIPGNGRVIVPADDQAINEVLQQGLWSELERIKVGDSDDKQSDWTAHLNKADGSDFTVVFRGDSQGTVQWSHNGHHNVSNALAALAAARHVGVTAPIAIAALNEFKGVKRRMELLGVINGVTVYDDFAHHPTAIATTLAGLRAKVGKQRIIALIEPRSNTMRLGSHLEALPTATQLADKVYWYQPEGVDWTLSSVVEASDGRAQLYHSIEVIIGEVLEQSREGDHIVIMSNGGFGGIQSALVKSLQS